MYFLRNHILSLLGALALGVTAHAQTDFTPEILLPNSSLEADADGDNWPDAWPKGGKGITWEQEEGNCFLRLHAAEPGHDTMVYLELPAQAGTALAVRLRQRVSGLVRGDQNWYDARVIMEFRGADGKVVGRPPAPIISAKDTAGWVEREATFSVPDGAARLVIMPYLFKVKAGTLDIDDFVVRTTDPAPVLEAERAAAEARAQKLAENSANRRAKAAELLASTGNLISNGNFEEPSKDGNSANFWGGMKPGTVSWEKEEGGNRFMRLVSPKPDEMVMLHRVIDIPEGVEALELTWRQNVTNLKKGAAPWFDARIILDLKDAAGKTLASPKPSAPATQKDTKGWVERNTSFLVSAETLSVELMPALFQVYRGTLEIDDLVLKPTDPAPLHAAAAERERAAQARYVAPEKPDLAKWPSELHVEGNKLVNKEGQHVILKGLNASGLETLPEDMQVVKSTVVGIDEWKANVVRLPVADKYWFGRGYTQKDGGKDYREKVDQIITLAANRGAYVVLDLHQFRAPKVEHAEFWADAAKRYKDHPAVLFDLLNEPFDISWETWRDGGPVGRNPLADESAFLTPEEKAKNEGYQSVGMQKLVDLVREAGAKNIVVIGGLAWASDLSGITKGYGLEDRGGNGIMYSWHIYNWHKGWEEKVLACAAQHPILVGEFGADVKKMDFIPLDIQEDPSTWVPDILGFIQKHELNWTAWCFHPQATPVMISDWNYTPTPFWGAHAKDALAGKKFEMKKMR
jgi:endoglucanase